MLFADGPDRLGQCGAVQLPVGGGVRLPRGIARAHQEVTAVAVLGVLQRAESVSEIISVDRIDRGTVDSPGFERGHLDPA